MKVLVTGLDGFIGKAVYRWLRRAGWEVVGFSVGPLAGRTPLVHRCSVTDFDAVKEVFAQERPQACIHLANLAHADVHPGDEPMIRHVNVDGTLNVARAAAAVGVEKLLYFSSAKVYGESTSAAGIDEDQPPNPVGIYSRLKLETEQALQELGKKGDIGVAFVRPVAVFGPSDSRSNYARLIRAARRGIFPVVDGGRARRSVVYLDRVAARVAQIIGPKFKAGHAYVLSDGAFEVREILKAIRRVTGFALFPSIPTLAARAAGTAVDKIWKLATGRDGPALKALARLTENFVVRAHRYDFEFGALPPFALNQAMEETCKPCHRGLDRLE